MTVAQVETAGKTTVLIVWIRAEAHSENN